MPTNNSQDTKTQPPTSEWCERKAKPGNRAGSPVHLTGRGHIKLDAVHEYLRALWNQGENVDFGLHLVNMVGGPPKCGILEWGMDLVLQKLGVDPVQIIRASNAGKPTLDLFRQVNRQQPADAPPKVDPKSPAAKGHRR
jgi:hypothetical protein